MSLNPLKAIGLNSIPAKILKLLINNVSFQLAVFFNLFFSPWNFPINIKKLIHKKNSHCLQKSVLITFFRQKYSTSHGLNNFTDKIREQLDSASFACGIFVDLKKAFGTADHDILIHKLNHYGIRGVANN